MPIYDDPLPQSCQPILDPTSNIALDAQGSNLRHEPFVWDFIYLFYYTYEMQCEDVCMYFVQTRRFFLTLDTTYILRKVYSNLYTYKLIIIFRKRLFTDLIYSII